MKATDFSTNLQLNLVENTNKAIKALVESKLQHAALLMAQNLVDQEILKLCGPMHSRKGGSKYHRGGSDPGSIILHGQKVKIKKHRVRDNKKQINLTTYEALQDYDLLSEKAVRHMLSGVSTRKYDDLLDEISGETGISKSTVSRAFVKDSRKVLEDLNSRDLSKYNFFAIMVDGIHFGASNVVVVAMGITLEGDKVVLGMRNGTTEDGEICRDLLNSLIERGLDKDQSMLFVIDGGKALKSSIKFIFGKKAFIQRCSLHKKRNIESYIPKKYLLELNRRWKRLHGCIDYDDALEEYSKLKSWLGSIHTQAQASLEEAEMETLTVIRLKIPTLLRRTLHSTNPIENIFSVTRPITNRVKNWKSGSDQSSRWAAITFLEAEKMFKKVKGYKQIPLVVENMNNLYIDHEAMVG